MSLAGSGARPAAQSSLLGGRSARVGGSPNPATRPPAEASFFRRLRVESEVMRPGSLR